MEIHELNNFNGTPGSTNYLAIDNGFDTARISGTDLLKQVNGRIDGVIEQNKETSVLLGVGSFESSGGTITLNESIADYDFIDVIIPASAGFQGSLRVRANFSAVAVTLPRTSDGNFASITDTRLDMLKFTINYSSNTSLTVSAIKIWKWEPNSAMETQPYIIDYSGTVDIQIWGIRYAQLDATELTDLRTAHNGTVYSTARAAREADYNALDEEINVLDSDIDNISISTSSEVNSFFRELYIVGLDPGQVAYIGFNMQGPTYSNINFKDSAKNLLATFSTASRDDILIERAMSGEEIYLCAFVDWSKRSLLSLDDNSVVLAKRTGILHMNPAIEEFLRNAESLELVPNYTKITGHRINTQGAIVTASSSWFYSSPIQVYAGDVVRLVCYGNDSASPISYTDASGSFYKPAVVYSGTDPDTYYLTIEKDGYIAISITQSAANRFLIYRNNYIAKLLRPINIAIDSTGRDEGSSAESIPIEAIKYGYKNPSRISGADISDPSAWNGVDMTLIEKSVKYDNITRRMRDCLSFTSAASSGYAYCNISPAVNAKTHPLMISICVGDYDDTNPPAGDVGIELFSGSARDTAHKATMNLVLSTGDVSYNPVFNRNGWINLCVFVPSVKEYRNNTVGADFDPTNVTAVGVHVYNTRGISNTVHVAQLDFMPAMNKPGIITIVDNFGVRVPAMADYAHSKGVRLNLSIIPGYYAGAPGAPICASKAELDRVAQQGHCIWNHTWTHQVLNNLNNVQIQDQINYAEKWMKQNGYGDDCRLVSIPSAQFTTAPSNSVFETNAEMIFHSWGGEQLAAFVPYYPAIRCLPTSILDAHYQDTMTPTQIAQVAAKAMTYGGITVIGFHGTYWDIDNGASWRAYIDALAEIDGAYFYGLDEIIGGMWC